MSGKAGAWWPPPGPTLIGTRPVSCPRLPRPTRARVQIWGMMRGMAKGAAYVEDGSMAAAAGHTAAVLREPRPAPGAAAPPPSRRPYDGEFLLRQLRERVAAAAAAA